MENKLKKKKKPKKNKVVPDLPRGGQLMARTQVSALNIRTSNSIL